MIGLKSLTIINPNPQISSISKPIYLPPPHTNFNFNFLASPFKNPKTQSKFPLFATNNNSDQQQKQQNNQSPHVKEEKNPIFNVKLGDLLLNPDPDNLVAVGLTGLLAWASAQVLWQLLIVSLAILVTAVKYSFVAALLVFILITLLCLPPAKYDGFLYKIGEVDSDSILIEAFFDPVCPDSRDAWPPLKQAFHHYGSRTSLILHLLPLPLVFLCSLSRV